MKELVTMNNKTLSLKNKKILLILTITIFAFVLRILCCFWGYPLQLHPDEGVIVNSAIDMLSRHSWLALAFDRPDHFEIKCDAILFTIVSWIKYHKPAYEAFEDHKMVFFLLGRFYTAVFGTLLVPLTYIVAGKLSYKFKEPEKSIIQFISAILVAFSVVFVQNSAYATPDVVLTFFVVLFCYFSILYLEQGKIIYVIILDAIIGIGLTIKYPAAMLCLPLAIVVIFKELIKNKKLGNVIKLAILSLGIILTVIFFLAPNLILDFNSVYTNFIEEARPNHLGADGLGFFGNLKYYADSVFKFVGIITILPFIIGMAYLIRKREGIFLALLPGAVFWVCLSVLSLHWLRWGIPIYPFYYLITAIGIGSVYSFFSKMHDKRKKTAIAGKTLVIVFSVVITMNVLLSGLAYTKFCLLKDSRIVAKEYLINNNISAEECLSEGYTPFSPSDTITCYENFILEDGNVRIADDLTDKKYFIMSNSFKSRYLKDKDRYSEQVAIYEGINNTYPVFYKVKTNGSYSNDKFVIRNIPNSVKYLFKSKMITGRPITIYDLKP